MANGLPSAEELAGRRAQMFPAMSAEQVERVSAYASVREFEAEAIVFEQGDRDVPLYVVLEGELEIVHPNGKLEELIVVHHQHEFSGEINLLTERRALVRGRAKTRLRLLCIEHAKLKALIQTDAELSELIMRAFILRRVGLLSSGQGDAVVIGARDSATTLRLEAFLRRNSHPFRYLDIERDTDVQAMLDEFQVSTEDIPILICRGDVVLRNPSNAEVAECLGFNLPLEPDALFDLVICGAGPGGLAAAVYGASEGLNVLVVEAHAPGGQAASSSKIENYLGFPTGISGQALAARALNQAEKFGARLHVASDVVRLHCEERPLRVELSQGASVRACAVVIATGAEYRKLELPELSRFEGAGIYYAATYVEAQRCNEEEVIVIGGGNSAGQAAMFLSQRSRHVHVVIRGANLAASMSHYLIRRIEEAPNVSLHTHTRIVALEGAEHLERVRLRDDRSGEESTRPVRHVFSMAGAAPNTDWLRGCVALDDKGFVRTGPDLSAEVLKAASWPLSRDPYLFETSQPRVFAVGDVRASSVKRVASAVGEGSVCVQLVHKVLTE